MFRVRTVTTLFLAAVCIGLGCHSPAKAVPPVAPAPVPAVAPDAVAVRAPIDPVATEVLQALDLGVDPCGDFYSFACGGWLEGKRIPAGRTQWRRGFDVAAQRVRSILRGILEAGFAGEVPDATLAAAQDMYAACLDEETIDNVGLEPLMPLLLELQGISDYREFMAGVAQLHRLGVPVLFQIIREPDPGDERIYTARILPGDLLLPSPDWYVTAAVDIGEDPVLSSVRDAAAALLVMVGYEDDRALEVSTQVLLFERELAVREPARSILRDPVRTNNRTDMRSLARWVRPLPLRTYLRAMGLPGDAPASVAVPDGLAEAARAALGTEPVVLAAWLQLRLLDALGLHLPRPLRAQVLAMRGAAAPELAEEPPRWESCVAETERGFGSRLGQEFVTLAFEGDEHAIARDVLFSVQQGFRPRLEELEWMDAVTRHRAAEKLDRMVQNVGWPPAASWTAPASVDRVHLVNVLHVRRAERARSLAKFGAPVDRSVWGVRPQAVNAYYRPGLNQVVVPAGILQPPFFDRTYPAAMNYGGLGAIIGHEIAHAFDDRGRRYDGEGRLRNWWTPATEVEFEGRAQCIAAHYEGLELDSGARLDGQLVLGESIADRGGLRQAYRAWRQVAPRATDSDRVLGLTGDQLFFVAFAQIWCARTSVERELRKARRAKHPPARVRVNEAVAAVPEFWNAFACGPATPMHLENSCQLW